MGGAVHHPFLRSSGPYPAEQNPRLFQDPFTAGKFRRRRARTGGKGIFDFVHGWYPKQARPPSIRGSFTVGLAHHGKEIDFHPWLGYRFRRSKPLPDDSEAMRQGLVLAHCSSPVPVITKRDRPNEVPLAFRAADFAAAHAKHQKMGCICYENQAMGIYFIADPDGCWLEILPSRR